MSKNTIIILLSATLISVAAIILVSKLRHEAEPGLVSLEEIRKIREFHVVSFRYEDLFFYHNKQDQGRRVVAIASVPVTLQAYFDMGRASLQPGDSQLVLILPAPQLTEPSYAFDEMRTRSVRRFSVIAGIDIHERMLLSLKEKVRERKADIVRHAHASGIGDMAVRQAEDYFRSFFTGLGYSDLTIRVESAPADTLSDREDGGESSLIGLEGISILE